MDAAALHVVSKPQPLLPNQVNNGFLSPEKSDHIPFGKHRRASQVRVVQKGRTAYERSAVHLRPSKV